MIRKADVRKFHARKRIDYRAWKRLSDDELERRVRALPIKPPIWHRLERTQKICFLIGATTRRFFFLNDMGTGKTLLAIALALYFRKLGLVKRVLVLVKRRPNKSEWVREIRKHTTTCTHLVLRGSSESKWRALEASDAFMVIETFPGLPRMLCDLKSVTRRKRKVNKLVPSRRKVRAFQKLFQGLIMDESTDVANKRALPFRICNQLSKTCEVVFPMTGTPFGRDPTTVWGQMFLVDRGYTLGETLGLYRAAFFTSRETPWSVEYKFDKTKRDTWKQYIANASVRFMADETSLPKLVHVVKYITLPQVADAYYQKAKQQLRDAHGNHTVTKNAFLRMRQISSGFIGYQDDETGEKAKFVFPHNPKLDLLMTYLEDLPYKAIVFHDFIFSGETIERTCHDAGMQTVPINGATKDPDAALHAFDHNRNARVLILNNAMAIGLNLQVAKYGFMFEAPVPVMIRQQAIRRFRRQHSSHARVFLYDLVVRHTVDETILRYHREGRDLQRALLEHAAAI